MVNVINGTNGADTRTGANDADLIYGFDPGGQVSRIDATRIAAGLNQPLFAGAPPGDLSRLFIVEKGGLIKILNFNNGKVLAKPFLDVSAESSDAGEGGLLGLAFDPNFAQNRFFYVNLINNNGDTEIRRYTVSASDPNKAVASSETLIIRVNQPGTQNHKAGWLGFGPDGYLYVPLGDGGGSGDPNNNAQNPNSLLGKVLRLDVRSDAFPDAARNYAIPADNPFVGADGIADEIWALGLRNPFRDSFDRALGTLFIADVGQNTYEEVNIGAAGANYGWDAFEGPDPFDPKPLGGGTLTAPIHFYNHNVGNVITGGYVYRGSSEGLQGHYFFADFGAEKIFTLRFNGTTWDATNRTAQIVTNAGSLDNVSSFGEDGAGNLYAVDIEGEVFRLSPRASTSDQGDVLRGEGGDDFLYGGSGNDNLKGGLGGDFLNGGPGFDYASYSEATARVTASLDAPRTNSGEAAGDLYVLIEGLIGSDFNDTLRGHSFANRVNVGSSDDVLLGGLGDDSLHGLAGDDRLYGGPGGDFLSGGTGFDVANYADSPARITVDLELARSQSGGDAQGDRLSSIQGVVGSEFADALLGTDGDNRLRGGGGDDVLVGRKGRDGLYGDAGGDRFDFNSRLDSSVGANRDVIADFHRSQGDKIDLSTIDANSKAPGNQAFKFIGGQGFHDRPGELHVMRVSGQNRVEGDMNGDGNADFQITVLGASLARGDFLL